VGPSDSVVFIAPPTEEESNSRIAPQARVLIVQVTDSDNASIEVSSLGYSTCVTACNCTVPCDCPHQCDYDGDNFLTGLDLGLLIDVLFAGHPEIQDPGFPTSRGDFDCDQMPTALDLGGLIDHLFAGGHPPCAPCSL
jgi:hypothetical protein